MFFFPVYRLFPTLFALCYLLVCLSGVSFISSSSNICSAVLSPLFIFLFSCQLSPSSILFISCYFRVEPLPIWFSVFFPFPLWWTILPIFYILLLPLNLSSLLSTSYPLYFHICFPVPSLNFCLAVLPFAFPRSPSALTFSLLPPFLPYDRFCTIFTSDVFVQSSIWEGRQRCHLHSLCFKVCLEGARRKTTEGDREGDTGNRGKKEWERRARRETEPEKTIWHFCVDGGLNVNELNFFFTLLNIRLLRFPYNTSNNHARYRQMRNQPYTHLQSDLQSQPIIHTHAFS